MRWSCTCWLAGVVLLASVSGASAQSTEPQPPFPFKDVTLSPKPDMFDNGKAIVVHGDVSELGFGFRLKGLTMLQPVAITVVAEKPAEPVELVIGKDWTTADRTARTDDKGVATELFRSDDVVEIRVHSPAGSGTAPRGYDLVIWAGDEKTDYPDMPSAMAFGNADRAKNGRAAAVASAPPAPPTGSASGSAAPTPATAAPAASGGGSNNTVLWVIAGLLAALVVIGGIAMMRRKK